MNSPSGQHPSKPREPEIGSVLAGRYRLESIIGRGGFGIVYKATRTDITQEMAIKVLLPEWIHQDPDLAIRFKREAILATKLRHRNTITLYDHGQTEDGIFYMAMEYVEGKTLSAILREESPIAPERLVPLFQQILESLLEAHTLGVVHRDLKPSNIMIMRHRNDMEFAKVLDFGVAKAMSPGVFGGGGDLSQTLTQAGRFCGTPRYMAPEQFRGGTITPGCDLYALGLIGYELLTGRPAIQGKAMVDVIVSQVTEPSLKLPATVRAPIGLRMSIERALEKDVTQRYASAAHFLHDLNFWQESSLPVYNPSASKEPDLGPEDINDSTVEMQGHMWADIIRQYPVPEGSSTPNSAPRYRPPTPSSLPPHNAEPDSPQEPATLPSRPEKLPPSALPSNPTSEQADATLDVAASPELLANLRADRQRFEQKVPAPPLVKPPHVISNPNGQRATEDFHAVSLNQEPNATTNRTLIVLIAIVSVLIVLGLAAFLALKFK